MLDQGHEPLLQRHTTLKVEEPVSRYLTRPAHDGRRSVAGSRSRHMVRIVSETSPRTVSPPATRQSWRLLYLLAGSGRSCSLCFSSRHWQLTLSHRHRFTAAEQLWSLSPPAQPATPSSRSSGYCQTFCRPRLRGAVRGTGPARQEPRPDRDDRRRTPLGVDPRHPDHQQGCFVPDLPQRPLLRCPARGA